MDYQRILSVYKQSIILTNNSIFLNSFHVGFVQNFYSK